MDQKTQNLQPEQPPPNELPEHDGSVQAKKPWGVILGTLYSACLLAALGLAFFTPKAQRGDASAPDKSKKSSPLAFFEAASDAIAIVRLDGLIAMERRGGFLGETMVDRIKKNLDRLAKKKNIKALILRINSPGGTVASSQEIYDAIGQIRRTHNKPIIALMGDVAASGGYYVASACDRIVAEPGTLTGSIGVIFQTGQFNELMKRWGISFNTIKSGPYKDIGSFNRPMTAEERQILQSLIDGAYEQFVQAVAQGRRMSPLEVRKLADGRIWLGSQAKKLRLIDEDSGMRGAINLARDLGKIKGEPKIVWDWDLRDDFLNELLQMDSQKKLFIHLGLAVGPLRSGLLYLWPGY